MSKGKRRKGIINFPNRIQQRQRRLQLARVQSELSKQEKFYEFYESNTPWVPINDYLLVECNQSEKTGSILLPDGSKQNINNEMQILAVSSLVNRLHPILRPGVICIHTGADRESHKFWHWIKNPDKDGDPVKVRLQFVKLSEIGAIIDKDRKVYPLGRKVRLRRLIEEEVTKGGIVIPSAQPTKDQSKEGVYIGRGILSTEDKPYSFDIPPFAKVRWKSWSEEHVECLIGNDYDLFIPEEDISYIDYDYSIERDNQTLKSLTRSR